MKIIRLMLILCFMVSATPLVWAIEGVLATDETIEMLKKDLLDKKVQVGKTRLKDIRKIYGDAADINVTDRKITYNYGDLRIAFEKKRYWRSWEYDSFKDPVYSDDVDDLRFDLESGELVGDNITYTKIVRQYDAPTESMETEEDGDKSIYYYGNIKLTFENYYVLQSWKGQNLGSVSTEEVLEGK